MTKSVKSLLYALLLSALALSHASAKERPKIVVTIAPIHSLVAALTAGVVKPNLLMPAGSSPHSFALKPSQAKALRTADVIVRVGASLETFLERPLEALGREAIIVTLDEIPGMRLLEVRSGGAWEAHDHVGHAHDTHGHDDHGNHAHADDNHESENHERHKAADAHNPHIWLDPRNAILAVDHIAGVLAKADPARAEQYLQNAGGLKEHLKALDRDVAAVTASVQGKPYIVFHDAYANFEDRYRLSPAGAITVSPERKPGAKRLGEIRDKISATRAQCVFSEPQFEPKLVATVIEGTQARGAVLDPLGASLSPGPALYDQLLRGLASSLVACLAKS